MSHSIESLQKTLAEGLDATHVIVIDETLGGCGAKFMFYICSTKFEGN